MRAPECTQHPQGGCAYPLPHAGPKMGTGPHWVSGGSSFRKSHAVRQLQRMRVAAADSVNTHKGQDAGFMDICFTKISGELFLGRVTSSQGLYAQAAPWRMEIHDASYLYVHGRFQEAVYNTSEIFIHFNPRSFLP